MRPELLNPYFRSLTSLPGIGPKLYLTLSKLLGRAGPLAEGRVIDLLAHLPTGLIDRRQRPGAANARAGEIATLEVVIGRHQPVPRNSRAPYRVRCHDETGEITLVFFHPNKDWLQRSLPEGEQRFVSGRVEFFNGQPQIVHPDHIVDAKAFAAMPLLEPIYPMTAGLSPKTVAKAMAAALDDMPDLPEWQNRAWLEGQKFPTFTEALRQVHRPTEPDAQMPLSPARRRLSFDELLASQLALALMRGRLRRAPGVAHEGSGEMRDNVIGALPFSLTASQRTAIGEISADLASPQRMLRLLQGDVGSGKTIVALMAMLQVIESGGQAALMAPTEILARQHLATLNVFTKPAGLTIAILTSREKGKARQATLDELQDGTINILVGTHAVFQSPIAFKNLALAVVDEQHRFGVHQRLSLADKGQAADVLLMTATPIPRTLVLSFFGDMDVSQLTDKPAGRQPVRTSKVSQDKLEQVVDRLATAVDTGAKAYWVCPLVEESETLDITAAEDRHAILAERFGERVGLIHGRMKGPQKEAVMAAFHSGRLQILVSTTVIEVGVDVPDATIMIIEQAERFGLAQMHQLRGRVGRGTGPSSCLLLYRAPLGPIAEARLETMCQTQDGFRIAEEDLRLRGEGEVLGTRQSGQPGFRLAQIALHGDLLEAARDDARLILQNDPDLDGARGPALRHLLYLFGRDEAIRLLQAG